MGFIINPAREEFGWSNTHITGVIAFRELIAGIVAPFIGWLIDKQGPRIIILTGSVLVGLSFSIVSFAQTFWQFVLVFSVIGGIGIAGLSNALVFPLIAKWFSVQRGRATGLVSSGANLGGILLSPIIIWLLSVSDWRSAWFFLGFLPVIILVPLAIFVLRREPEGMELQSSGEALISREWAEKNSPDLTLSEAIRTPGFWYLIVGWNLSDFVLKGTLLHKIPAAESQGFSTFQAGSVILSYGIFAILGKLLTGFVVDRLSPKLVILVLSALQALGIIVFIQAGSIWQLQLGYGVLSGLSAGGLIMIMPFLLASLFGRKNQGVIMGVVTPLIMISGIGGPLLAALLFDITGSYISAFEIYAVIAVTSGLILFKASKSL